MIWLLILSLLTSQSDLAPPPINFTTEHFAYRGRRYKITYANNEMAIERENTPPPDDVPWDYMGCSHGCGIMVLFGVLFWLVVGYVIWKLLV